MLLFIIFWCSWIDWFSHDTFNNFHIFRSWSWSWKYRYMSNFIQLQRFKYQLDYEDWNYPLKREKNDCIRLDRGVPPTTMLNVITEIYQSEEKSLWIPVSCFNSWNNIASDFRLTSDVKRLCLKVMGENKISMTRRRDRKPSNALFHHWIVKSWR